MSGKVQADSSTYNMTHYEQLLRWAINKHKVVYLALLLMVVVSILMMPYLHIDTDPENMLSSDAEERVFHNLTKQQFAMRDMIVVGIVSDESIYTQSNLAIVHHFSEQIVDINGVVTQDLLSLTTVDNITQSIDKEGNSNGIRFSYLMKTVPETKEEVRHLRSAVERLPMLHNTLVSADAKAIAIYVPIESKDLSYQIAEQIRVIIDAIKTVQNEPIASNTLSFHITGLPVAEDQFGVEMFIQMGVAAPLAGVAIFALLWYFFRCLPLIVAPMIVAVATVVIVMGTLIGMGFTVHIMSSMIAIFLMPIAVVDSVHILSEFSDRHREGQNVRTTIIEVMRHLYKPMLLTSVTSAVGFYSLMLTPIPPVKVFGAFIGSGILLAFILTIIFIPVYIVRLSPKSITLLHIARTKQNKKRGLATLLPALGEFAVNTRKYVLLAFILVFIISVEGITRIQVNDNPVNWFKSDHEIRVADKVLNSHFAGTYDAWLVLDASKQLQTEVTTKFQRIVKQAENSGLDTTALKDYLASDELAGKSIFTQELLVLLDDLSFSANERHYHNLNLLTQIAESAFDQQQVFTQPDVLAWMSAMQAELIESGLVGIVNSLNDIVKTVNRELTSGTDADFVLPATRQGVAQTLLQYQSSHRPQDLWHFVSADFQKSLMWLQLTSGDNQHTSQVVDWVEQYIAQHPAPVDVSVDWAGKSYLNIVWQEAMVNGMADSLISSFVAVFVMMILLFRSIKFGVLAMLPLTFTITMIYGLIGWLGKAYDMPIAVLSALTLGLSIDFAIHFLQRTKELIQEVGNVRMALVMMFEEPARAISRNAIVIAIGFTPLLFSPLVPYITVGFFLASIMAVSALVTLTLLPALLMIFDTFNSPHTDSAS